MNVAILIPTYNNNEVLQRCLNYLHNLNPQPQYYIFFTNNDTDNTVKIISIWKKIHPNTILINKDYEENFIKEQLAKNPYNMIGIARQALLEEARKLKVDYAIFIDDDILIVDKNFITRITGNGKSLVGGAYFRSYPQGDFLCYLVKNRKSNKSTHPYILRNYLKNRLFKVAATSGGCLCIAKNLLMDTTVNFYPIPDYYHKGKAGEDFAYCVTARKHGYSVWVDDRFQICHYQIHKARAWREKDVNR